MILRMFGKLICFLILLILLLVNNLFAYNDISLPLSIVSLIDNTNFNTLNQPSLNINLKVKGFKNVGIVKEINKNSYIYTQDNLIKNNYFTVYDALGNTPGITIGKSFKDVIDIRGQGEDARRRVQVLFDDIPLNLLDNNHYYPGFNIFPSTAIEKVEIIPGGGSVIYGNGTQGGVINILTNFRSEHSKPNNQIYQGFASFNTKRFAASLGNYLLNNRLFLQLDYNRVDDEAYQREVWAKKEFISFSTKVNLTEKQIIGYSYNNYKVDGVFTNNVSKSNLKKDWRARGSLYKHGRTENFHKFSFQGRYFNNFTIDNLAFYNEHTYSQRNITKNLLSPDFGKFPQNTRGNKLKTKLVYGSNKKNFLLLGSDIINTHYQMLPLNKPPWNIKKDTYAVFAINKFYLKEAYLLTGYRYNLDKWNKSYPAKDVQKPNNIKYIYVNSKKQYNAYNLGVGLDFTKNNTAWLGLETGFTAPESTYLTNKLNSNYIPNPSIKYETFKTIELGTEHKLFSTDTYLRAVVFNTYTKNEISRLFIGFKNAYALNIGNSSRNGIEFNIQQYLLQDIISLNFGITAINAKYKEINYKALEQYIKDIKEHSNIPIKEIDKEVKNLINSLEERKGKTIKKVPPVTLNARVNIKILEPLTFSTHFHYFSSYMASLDKTYTGIDKTNGKLITDLSLSYNANNLFISIGINNITNQKYFINDSHGGSSKYGVGVSSPAMLRNYFFDMKYKFNFS